MECSKVFLFLACKWTQEQLFILSYLKCMSPLLVHT